MWQRAIPTLVIAACTHTRARAPDPARCMPIAEATAEAGRARQRNDQRFKDQLVAKGLELVAFATAGVENDEQTEITVRENTTGGVPRRVLVTPSSTCAAGTIQLAKNAQQELYALEIHERGTNGFITACGCEPAANATCGGAAVQPITILYALPDELTYKGTLAIEYDVDPDNVLFTGTRPDGGNCPPPPPPPP